MNSTAIKRIQHTAQMKEGEHTIRLLGKALIQTFRIPQGSEFALLLANTPARNNEEAVYQWVRETLSCPNTAVALAVLPQLVDAFDKHIHSLEDLSWKV